MRLRKRALELQELPSKSFGFQTPLDGTIVTLLLDLNQKNSYNQTNKEKIVILSTTLKVPHRGSVD